MFFAEGVCFGMLIIGPFSTEVGKCLRITL
jgi:hypothetical protein